MSDAESSRRMFLLLGGGVLTSTWLAANAPAIAAAVEHARGPDQGGGVEGCGFLSAADAADVEAITAQIIPSGTTPGAREARAVRFADRALSSFFSDWARDFRSGLADFQSRFHAEHPAIPAFAAASADQQLAFLRQVEESSFFEMMRILTVLGTFSAPQYGGNDGQAGWKLLRFEDQHVFAPPFGYYDREYAGFVPYPGFRTWTAHEPPQHEGAGTPGTGGG